MTKPPEDCSFGRISLSLGQPLNLSDVSERSPGVSGEEVEYRRAVGRCIKSYLAAISKLLEGKYRHIRDLAPIHMTSACRPYVFIFPEGVAIRYDLQDNPNLEVLIATPVELCKDDGTSLEVSLASAMPLISERFLHIVAEPHTYDPGPDTPTLQIGVGPQNSGQAREIAKQRIFAVTAPPSLALETNAETSRHVPTISVRNEFDLLINFETEPQGSSPPRQFLLRSRFKLPSGWEALEVYPRYPISMWNPENTELWAESDLLAAVMARNLRDNEFKALDPMSEARKKMAAVIAGCSALLDGPEEPLHQYIKSNPGLLCPTHYQAWSKLPLGKRNTDFVFREPSGEYLLVELESPLRPLFRTDGQPREELTHAVNQVADWLRYIADNLRTVEHELGLREISPNPSCLIVIGRSVSLGPEDRRKLATLQSMMPKLRIITFDDMLANVRASAENLLGPLWDPGPHAEVYLLS